MSKVGRRTKRQPVDLKKAGMWGAFAFLAAGILLVVSALLAPLALASGGIGAALLPGAAGDRRYARYASSALIAGGVILGIVLYVPVFQDWTSVYPLMVSFAVVAEVAGAAALGLAFHHKFPKAFLLASAAALAIRLIAGVLGAGQLSVAANALGHLALSAGLAIAAFDVLSHTMGAGASAQAGASTK